MSFAEVAVALPVSGTFTYSLPDALARDVVVGSRVSVPFGQRPAVGYVVALRAEAPAGVDAKPVRDVLGGAPLDEEMVRFLLWAADYYLAPPGEMMRAALPSGTHTLETRRVKLLVEPMATIKSARERAILAALQSAPEQELDERALRRSVGDCAAALTRLAERGIVQRTTGEEAARVKVRLEDTFAIAREPTAEELVQLERAPRRKEVWQRVREGGGAPLGASALRDLPRGKAHAVALAEAGLFQRGQREVVRDPFRGEPAPPHPAPVLNARQAAAVEAIDGALGKDSFAAFLLHGVTGSGKTEVYLRVIATARRAGHGAMVLVPEISLTPQLAARFRARFGDDVAVLHSGLTDGERFDAWRRLRDGRVGIALGARSAVFAPVRNLGIIVVDEEHDGSFKQEEGVRYHARDLALVRAQKTNAVCVLGSATPSLETFSNTRLVRLELPERATPRPLPSVEIIDLRKHRPDKDGMISAPLALALEQTLRAGEQSILFLNRRGFATFLLCKSCGQALRCRDCSVTLTLHKSRGAAICHYCGFQLPRPQACPHCKATPLSELGTGTERVEAALRERFPEARIGRLDRDTGGGAGLRQLLGAMTRRELDILVGTQMVTKGHDFPGVTLVGVVLADTGLHLPDFRAAERTFQLLEQVAGRAGRGNQPGRVLVQTYNPQHPSIVCAAAHDYEGFAKIELAARAELGYPPLGRLIALRIDGPDERAVRQIAEEVGRAARGVTAAQEEPVRPSVLGPAAAPLARLRGRTRWQLLLRGQDRKALREAAWRAAHAVKPPRDLRVAIDVDPMSAL